MTEIKSEILEKSMEMFLDLGFKSVTMDDISSEMGMSKKTLYSYFKNKEELITEVTLK
ncbi:helix-turn-helix transcriptional regulator, partial [Nonlabens mediterrranea]|nr:helix-turn-helix transcriptional regulator [Nonlabens mediterrranea]